jgi:glycosyltransferase involved in cell wall biosynthesis
MNHKLVSIIIPTFNRVHLLGETLDSILSQTYTNWECLIIDDGSTEDVFEVVAKYIQLDLRFQFYERPKNRTKGANACRNYGFELSKGDYIKWFDSDDLMYPNFLQKQLTLLEEQKELDFCVCLANSFSTDKSDTFLYKANRNIQHDKLTSFLVKNHYFFTPAPLWKSDFLRGKELFDEELSDSHETDFHFRMLSYDVKYKYIEDALFSIRRGHSSITQDKENAAISNLSRLKFFIKAFDIVKKNQVDDKAALQKYILHRQLTTFYYLNLSYSLCITRAYFVVIFKNIFTTKHSIINKILFCFGIFFSFFFKNGYAFFKNAKVDIVEVIEN